MQKTIISSDGFTDGTKDAKNIKLSKDDYLTPENMKETLSGVYDIFKPMRYMIRQNALQGLRPIDEVIKEAELRAMERSTDADVESPECSGK